MHLQARLRQFVRTGGYFIEIGAGEGDLSHLLLSHGLSGCGFDLNPEACRRNRLRNAEAIRTGRYVVFEEDFLRADLPRTVDVIVCAMVIEHLPALQVCRLFDRVAELLGRD
jgi:2-polyprenyl-3-methyl-5-hydroxy-6-metoxy-1,4-benzoquinol methylase